MSRRRKPKGKMEESLMLNDMTYKHYLNRLTEFAISVFEWENLPPSVDARWLEMCLFSDGMCVFFRDEVMGELCLKTMISGLWNVYNIPIERTAYATNGYQRRLTQEDSVIIFNNMLHTNSLLDVELYSRKLWNLERTIDVNVNAQKTPTLIQCSENQRLSLQNVYMQWEGNEPVIYGEKSLDLSGLKVLKTDAPFIASDLYNLKTSYWNEILTILGIPNVNFEKKERMLQDEVTRNLGGVVASRFSRLFARQQACEQINAMFGTNISVKYRAEMELVSSDEVFDEIDEPESEDSDNE